MRTKSTMTVLSRSTLDKADRDAACMVELLRETFSLTETLIEHLTPWWDIFSRKLRPSNVTDEAIDTFRKNHSKQLSETLRLKRCIFRHHHGWKRPAKPQGGRP